MVADPQELRPFAAIVGASNESSLPDDAFPLSVFFRTLWPDARREDAQP